MLSILGGFVCLPVFPNRLLPDGSLPVPLEVFDAERASMLLGLPLVASIGFTMCRLPTQQLGVASRHLNFSPNGRSRSFEVRLTPLCVGTGNGHRPGTAYVSPGGPSSYTCLTQRKRNAIGQLTIAPMDPNSPPSSPVSQPLSTLPKMSNSSVNLDRYPFSIASDVHTKGFRSHRGL